MLPHSLTQGLLFTCTVTKRAADSCSCASLGGYDLMVLALACRCRVSP